MLVIMTVGFLLLVVLAILLVKAFVELLAQIIARVIEIRANFKKALKEEGNPA